MANSDLKGWPLIPKGEAMACHLAPEFEEGKLAPNGSENPYDFFGDKLKHTAWCYGNQKSLIGK